MGPRTGLDGVERRKTLPLSRLELRTLGRPARSQSLDRLRYPGYLFPTKVLIVLSTNLCVHVFSPHDC
jgi:hypothetical protein